MTIEILLADQKGYGVRIKELRDVFNEFNFCIPRQRIVHLIYKRTMPHTESDYDIDKDLKLQSFHGFIFIVAKHLDHYHIIHDCNLRNHRCRCHRIQTIQKKRFRYIKKVTNSSIWTSQQWCNLLQYLDEGTRRIKWLEICRCKWVRNSKNEFISFWHNYKFKLDRSMEDLRVQDYRAESNLYPGCEIDAEYYEMFVSNQDNFKDDIQKKTRTK